MHSQNDSRQTHGYCCLNMKLWWDGLSFAKNLKCYQLFIPRISQLSSIDFITNERDCFRKKQSVWLEEGFSLQPLEVNQDIVEIISIELISIDRVVDWLISIGADLFATYFQVRADIPGAICTSYHYDFRWKNEVKESLWYCGKHSRTAGVV